MIQCHEYIQYNIKIYYIFSIKKKNDDSSDAIAKCKIFAVNYNIMRIMSGMGGLVYSN